MRHLAADRNTRSVCYYNTFRVIRKDKNELPILLVLFNAGEDLHLTWLITMRWFYPRRQPASCVYWWA